MSEVSLQEVADLLVSACKDIDDVQQKDIKPVILDPQYQTYEAAGHWIKIPKKEPKSFKFTPLHREYSVIDTIARYNRATQDMNLHVPLTEPVKIDDSSEFVEYPTLITQKIDGEPIFNLIRGENELSSSESEKIGEQIGRFLARIHSIKAKGAGIFSVKGEGVHPGPWQKYHPLMLEHQHKAIMDSGVIEDSQIEKFFEILDGKKNVMIGEVVALSHNDLNFANIWADRESGKITGFVNFMKVGSASPVSDLCSLYIHGHDNKLWEEICKGYEGIRSLPDKFELRLPYYSSSFALASAWFFHMRKQEHNKNYYLNRAYREIAKFDDSMMSQASRYSDFTKQQF